MPIVILLCVLPLALAGGVQYAVCRYAKKKLWRFAPLLLWFAVTAGVGLARYHGWSADGGQGAPIETLLVIPGVPSAVVLAGLFAGWRVWRYRWRPRVIRDRKK